MRPDDVRPHRHHARHQSQQAEPSRRIEERGTEPGNFFTLSLISFLHQANRCPVGLALGNRAAGGSLAAPRAQDLSPPRPINDDICSLQCLDRRRGGSRGGGGRPCWGSRLRSCVILGRRLIGLRLPGGTCTHWKAPPGHGTRQSYFLAFLRRGPHLGPVIQLDHMRPGDPVTLAIDAYPERRIHGHVESVPLHFRMPLRPGGGGMVEAALERAPLLLVPNS
jgi:hypothetical protein